MFTSGVPLARDDDRSAPVASANKTLPSALPRRVQARPGQPLFVTFGAQKQTSVFLLNLQNRWPGGTAWGPGGQR